MHARPAAKEARGNDTRVVQDNELVSVKQIGEAGEEPVFDPGARATRQQQESRGIAPRERVLGDLRRREFVIEVL